MKPFAVTFSIAALTIASVTSVFAQSASNATRPEPDFKRHELRLGAGAFSSNDLIDSYSDVASSAITGGMYSVSDEKTSGNYSLTYRYALKPRLSVGGAVVYSRLTSDFNSGGSSTGKSLNNYFTLAPEVEYKYINKKNFRMYGFVGAGMTLNNQKVTESGAPSTSNTPYFNFQVTPIGIQVGHNFGGFLEGGFGYKGIVNVGFFARF